MNRFFTIDEARSHAAETLEIGPLFLRIVFLSTFLVGCAVTDNSVNKQVTKIVYSFKDASIPPQYHRSYTISVTRDHSHIIVNSYGVVLAEATVDASEQVIEELLRYLKVYQIKEKQSKSDPEFCAGGTSKSLTIFSDNDILLNGTVYQCGDRQEGTFSGDIDAFAQKIEALIPDFTDLLK